MEATMTVLGTGADYLVALMRRDRVRDLDTSWLLFGPEGEAGAEEEAEADLGFRFAAE